MTAGLRQLVTETAELTGAEGPAVWAAGAPVLDADAITRGGEKGVYFVGIIGGKDVGKSALINALVGQAITEPIGWGEGTQSVIAYAHTSQAEGVRELLEREVPGRFRVITHTVTDLRRQVLLDLPDIDSHWTDHIAITRKMLRHMLYPIWMQSVEKYADRQVQDLLRQVAGGNDPGNFVFVLNKVDQLVPRHEGAEKPPHARESKTDDAIAELRDDFARRIANALRLEQPPRVYGISAISAGEYELPELRRVLTRQKSEQAVRSATEQASRRQALSVLEWVHQQGLPSQLQRLTRLQEQAEELIQARVTPLVLEQAGLGGDDDPSRRLELIDTALGRRVRHWPLVNVLHAVVWPVLAMIRANVAKGTRGGREETGARVALAVQGVFAQLYQSQPMVGSLYSHRKLWEPMVAEQATIRLSDALGQTHGVHRSTVIDRAGRATMPLAPLRWMLTIGALLWFPFVQPVLSMLLPAREWPGVADVLVLLVQVISVAYLLEIAAFLLLWYFVLWLVLRWHTQARVDRILARAEPDDASAPAAVASGWVEELLEPLHRRSERLGKVVREVQRLEQENA